MAEASMEDRVAGIMGLTDEAPTPAPKVAAVPKAAPPVPEGDDVPDDLPDDLPDLDEGEEAPPEVPVDDSIELEIAGEQKRLTKAELKAIAEEHRTYKDTAESLKAQRAALEGERRAAREIAQLAPVVEATRAEGRLLVQAMQGLDQEIRTLAESDPVAAFQKREQFNALQQRFNALAQQDQQASAHMKALQQQQYQQQLAAEAPKLLEKIPAWRDTAKRQSDTKFIQEWMLEEGYTPEHVGMLTDARYVSTVLKAAKYDAIMKKQASKKVATAPQMARPGAAPAPGAQAQQAKHDYRKTVDAANKRGDYHKAARLAEQEFLRRLK